MEQVNMIGIDLAKNSFQLHGARADGSVAFRKKLSRAKLLDFVAAQPRCTVAMEACGQMRRDRENQLLDRSSQARVPDLDPFRVSPYRPAASNRSHQQAE